MSSYCPQQYYFTMNGVNYYYAQSCDSCSYVCVAVGNPPPSNCGGCCANCCPKPCPGLIQNNDAAIVAALKTETIATIPVRNVALGAYVQPNSPITTFTSPISIDTDDSVKLVDDAGAELCRLRLLGVRVGLGNGNQWLMMHVGQQLPNTAPVPNGTVKKTMVTTGKYHRVKFPGLLDTREFDVITLDDINLGVPKAVASAPRAARGRGRRRG